MIVRGGTFGPVLTNTFVVADRQGGSAILVDPALGSERWAADTIARLGVDLVAVYDTHGHWDHVVENHLWAARGIPVWAGEGDRDWLLDPAPFNPALFGFPPPVPGVEPSRIVGDGDVLEVGDLRLEIIETPGHSPGCLVAHERTHGQALVGDLVFAQGIGRTDFPRSDHTAMLRSLERVFSELPPATRIHPGHNQWDVALSEAEPWARMFM